MYKDKNKTIDLNIAGIEKIFLEIPGNLLKS